MRDAWFPWRDPDWKSLTVPGASDLPLLRRISCRSCDWVNWVQELDIAVGDDDDRDGEGKYKYQPRVLKGELKFDWRLNVGYNDLWNIS